MSHDPNDPDITTDPNYIGEPNYVDPNAFVNWNPICDFDDDYDVDMGDLASFCEDWLWQACWRVGYLQGVGGLGTEGLIVPLTAESLSLTVATTEVTPVPEPTPLTFEENILAIVDYLDLVIAEGAPNTESAYEIKAFLEEWLDEIQIQKEQPLDF